MKSRPRLVASVSILLFCAIVLSYLWWGRFHYFYQWLRLAAYASGVLIVVGNHIFFADERRQLGLRIDNFSEGLKTFGGPTLLICLVIITTGLVSGTVSLSHWHSLEDYVLWAAVQQHFLQNFLRLRSLNIVNGERRGKTVWIAMVLAATLFALFHLPNRPLFLGSFLAALLWCYLFTRTPNLICSTLSQILITASLLLCFKFQVFEQFQVGMQGYRFHYYGSGVRVAGGITADHNPFVATIPAPDWRTRSLVKIWNPSGQELAEWEAFPETDFSGELWVADVGFGQGDEIIVSPGPAYGNPASVRVFSPTGELLSDFSASAVSTDFGAWVSAGCGSIWVFPGPAPSAGQKAAHYTPTGTLIQLYNFPELDLVNGLRGVPLCTAVVSAEGMRHEEPQTLLLWGTDIAVNPSRVYVYSLEDGELRSFSTLDTTFGLQATPARISNSTIGLAVAPGPLKGYPPHVRVFDLDGAARFAFTAFSDPATYGTHLGTVDVNGDGVDELVLGEGTGPGRPYSVRIFTLKGKQLAEWTAY